MKKHRFPLLRERTSAGFSFIELVIVVAVLGILTAIAIPSYGAIQSNAKQAAVAASADTSYKAVAANLIMEKSSKTPAQVLAGFSNDTVKLSFLNQAGEVIATPASDSFCVRAYNALERTETDAYRYQALEGDCGTPGDNEGETPEEGGNEVPPVNDKLTVCDNAQLTIVGDAKLTCERVNAVPNSGGVDSYLITVVGTTAEYSAWSIEANFATVPGYSKYRVWGTPMAEFESPSPQATITGVDNSWNGAPASFGNNRYVNSSKTLTFNLQVHKSAPLSS